MGGEVGEKSFKQMKQLLFGIILLISFGDIFAQMQPRLVVPVGHSNGEVNKFISSDSTFLFTTETFVKDSSERSLLIVWDLWSKKEVYRKEILGGDELSDLIQENPTEHILIFKGSVLHKINFEDNTHDTLSFKLSGRHLRIPNTPLCIIGNKDSISIIDIDRFLVIDQLNIDFNDLVKWGSNIHQSGSFGIKSILLVKPKDAANFLLVYDPYTTIQLRRLPFDFKIKKVFFFNPDVILVQKEISENQKESIYIYPFNLSLNSFLPPVPFHKYAINVFEYYGNGGLISSGNDGRLVFRDSNLIMTKEINVKKEFDLPSFTKIQLHDNQLFFEAVKKKNKPRQAEDSICITGLLDLNSFKIIHSDSIFLDLPVTIEEDYVESSEEDFIYGLDRSYSYFSNENGKIKVATFFDTMYTEVLTITSDFRFSFENISNDSIKLKIEFLVNLDDFFDTLPENLFELLKKRNSSLIQQDFAEDVQKAYYKESKLALKIANDKWKLHSNLSAIDSINYFYFDSLMYGKKVLITNSLKTTDSYVSPPRLESFKNYKLLFKELNEDSTLVYLLRKGKILDQIVIPSAFDIPNTARHFYFTERLKIPFRRYELSFPDFPGSNLLPYFVDYPGKRLHVENSKNRTESIDLQTQMKELKIVKSRFKIELIDSIYKTDYLGVKTNQYLFDTPLNHVFYDYKQTKMWINPGKYQQTVCIDSSGVRSDYFLKEGGETFLPLYWSSNYNNPFSLLFLRYLDEYKELNEYHFDKEKNKIFSSSAQQYFGKDLMLHTNEIFHGCFLDKQIFVVSDASNNFFHVRNFDNKQLFTFVILEGGQYLFFDEFYHFDGTPEAIQQLYLTCGLEVVELSQIKEAMYIPNLVQRILNGEDLSHLTKLSEISICGIAPKVLPLKSANGQIRYKITPQNGGVGQVEIYLNGVLRKIVNSSELLLQNGAYILEVESELIEKFKIDGQMSSVKIIAKTKDSQVSSRSVTVEVLEENTASLRKPSLYAIMVGIDAYKDQSLALKYAAKDANDLHRILESAAKNYFNIDDTNKVFFFNLTVNSEGKTGAKDIKGITPDRGNLIRTLEYIEKVSKSEDILLLFFAGHGEIVDQNQLLLLTAESTRDNFQGLRMSEILDLMNKTPAGKRVLILDACHSGAAINNLDLVAFSGKRDVSEAERESQRIKELDKLASKSGFAILTASASDQKALEMPQYEHGLLTFALINAVVNNNNSLNEKNQLVLEKWFIAAEDEMRKMNLEQTAEKMIPVSFNIGVINEQVRQTVQMKKTPTIYVENVLNKESLADDFMIRKKLDLMLREKQNNVSQIPFLMAELPDALSVNILYEQRGEALFFSVKLKKNNEYKLYNYETNIEDLNRIIAQITADIINYIAHQ